MRTPLNHWHCKLFNAQTMCSSACIFHFLFCDNTYNLSNSVDGKSRLNSFKVFLEAGALFLKWFSFCRYGSLDLLFSVKVVSAVSVVLELCCIVLEDQPCAKSEKVQRGSASASRYVRIKVLALGQSLFLQLRNTFLGWPTFLGGGLCSTYIGLLNKCHAWRGQLHSHCYIQGVHIAGPQEHGALPEHGITACTP